MDITLTLPEKAALLSGASVWETRGIPRAGLRSLVLSDGPHGIRRQSGASDHLGLHGSEPATCFPTAATIANSWDPALGEEIGAALGREAAALGVDVVLGPGLNIKRSPLCGRNFEYFSEDPLLSGWLAAGYVRGIQSQGVLASPKHFAANSQETRRMTSDSRVDERTLREIYLTGFEIVVRESAPGVLMSSYNRVNGEYAHQNAHLLDQVLRREWGFDGVVVSDWGGGDDPVAAARAGGTLEMPSPGWDSARRIVAAVESGELAEEDLDRRVEEMRRMVERLDEAADVAREAAESVDHEAHHALARRAAAESVVLLKNDPVDQEPLLPLAAGTRVAVVGDFASTPRYQGAGSSLVEPTRLTTPLEAVEDSPLECLGHAQGFTRGGVPDPALVEEARALARRADVVVLHLGLDEISESEGLDRRHLRLPEAQIRLLEELSEETPRIVVVLSAGSSVEAPWLDRAAAVVHGHLGGQAGAEAMVQVLAGEVTPGGRLAESWAHRLEDAAVGVDYPVDGPEVRYEEGRMVGYRHHRTAGIPPLFPFGFGLSYTTFEYSQLEVDDEGASVTLTNTGTVSGAETAQLYVSREEPSAVERPARELAGWQKVRLAPGESRRVRLAFDERTFRHYDVGSGGWRVESGVWRIIVAAHAESSELSAVHEVRGDLAAVSPSEDGVDAAGGRPPRRTEQAGRGLGAGTWRRRDLAADDPLSAMAQARSPVARGAARLLEVLLARAEARGTPDLNLLFLQGMPFRAIAKMTGGAVSSEMVGEVLRIVNGRHLAGGVGLIRSAVRSRTAARRLRHAVESGASRTASHEASRAPALATTMKETS